MASTPAPDSPPARLRIDFVSDVACPWCAIDLASLRVALGRLEGTVQAEIHLQPFELNPGLPPEGEDANEHLMRKYGIGETQLESNRAMIRERAAALGFAFNMRKGSRIHNTFDAHRLLHWAGLQDLDRALTLKRALLRAYFTHGEDISNHAVLVRIAIDSGLDAAQASRVLESQEYAEAVREQERTYRQAGIQSVPATIVNGQYLISGGQPPDAFERALRDIAAGVAGARTELH